MNILLFAIAMIATIAFGTVLYVYIRSLRELARYQDIANVEDHKLDCETKANAALQQYQNATNLLAALNEQLTAHRSKVAQYQQLLGNLKTAADLQQKVQNDTARIQQLAATLAGLERATKLDDYLRSQQAEVARKKSEIEVMSQALHGARSAMEIAAQVKYYENYLAVLKSDVEAVEESRSLHEFAFYRPHYNFDTSERYQTQLDRVRDQQKAMLNEKTACVCTTEWTVEGSKREGEKMVNQQIKLMLRAFNGECDAAIGKVRYNNMVSIENRISRAFEQINKLGETKKIYIASQYSDLKFAELRLAYEYQQRKEEEREQQREIREQMKEEEKAAKEIEKACEAADREEAQKLQALEKARGELAQRMGQQTSKLELLVTKLENELKEAIDRKAKAIARAQLTRSGHVYILSNIGTFGEGVYKIGMSRRLEPLERVNELGSASVPFPFDVHAMIYCEDAPGLENALHRHFAQRRVNMVNLRREFFHVTLDEIRAAVAQNFGQVTFVTVPQAEQYHQTIALRKDQEQGAATLQIA